MSSLPSIEDKRTWIEERIEQMFTSPNKSDLIALDFEISILICAVQSYKHETILKPFPSTFLSDSNNNKNFNELVSSFLIFIFEASWLLINVYNYKLSAIESLPAIPEWRTKIKRFNKEQLSLVYWFLVHKNYKLEYSTLINQVWIFILSLPNRIWFLLLLYLIKGQTQRAYKIHRKFSKAYSCIWNST